MNPMLDVVNALRSSGIAHQHEDNNTVVLLCSTLTLTEIARVVRQLYDECESMRKYLIRIRYELSLVIHMGADYPMNCSEELLKGGRCTIYCCAEYA